MKLHMSYIKMSPAKFKRGSFSNLQAVWCGDAKLKSWSNGVSASRVGGLRRGCEERSRWRKTKGGAR